MDLPKIVVGGFSHTGTSLVVQILYEMGFGVGNLHKMNQYDAKKRPFGYWTYKPLRSIVHGYVEQKLGRGFAHACAPGYMPKVHLPPNPKIAAQIQELAEKDNVEVFKELSLPLTWSLFSKDAKYIFMSRGEKILHQHWAHKVKTYKQFHTAWARYQKMGKDMAEHRSVLFMQYEDFEKELPRIVAAIANHVGADLTKLDMNKSERIYRKDKKTIDV